MADIDGASEKSWWDSFVDGAKELAGTYLNYDLAKTQASNSSTTSPAPVTTPASGIDNNTMLLVGGGILLVALILVMKK